MKKLTTLSILVATSLVLSSCGNENEEINTDLLSDLEFADSLKAEVEIPESIIDEMIHSIPSPIEMTTLILSSGSVYDQKLLNDPENIPNYESSLKKALNLGVFGTDLGYLNIYEKTMLGIDYVTAVRTLSRGLKVEQFFDFTTLKRLSQENNIDSLLNITTQGFSKMDAYLREQNRTKASVMIVTGTFVESLFLATQIASKSPNKALLERIGEQKMSLNNMISMLEVYQSDPEVAKLIVDFKKLKVPYDEVEIITTYGDPITKEVDGMLVIEDQSTSEVVMSDELLKEIISKTNELRTKII